MTDGTDVILRRERNLKDYVDYASDQRERLAERLAAEATKNLKSEKSRSAPLVRGRLRPPKPLCPADNLCRQPNPLSEREWESIDFLAGKNAENAKQSLKLCELRELCVRIERRERKAIFKTLRTSRTLRENYWADNVRLEKTFGRQQAGSLFREVFSSLLRGENLF